MNIICALANLYILVIVARAIVSFFPIGPGSALAPVAQVLYQLTEPVFAPVRRVIPTIGMLDLTPLVVLIGVQILASFLGC